MSLGNKEVLDLKHEAHELTKEQKRLKKSIGNLNSDHEGHAKAHRFKEAEAAMKKLNIFYSRDAAIDNRLAWIRGRLLGSWGRQAMIKPPRADFRDGVALEAGEQPSWLNEDGKPIKRGRK